jgi:hypothetical protein
MSDSLETVQNEQAKLKEVTEKEAMDQFVKYKDW